VSDSSQRGQCVSCAPAVAAEDTVVFASATAAAVASVAFPARAATSIFEKPRTSRLSAAGFVDLVAAVAAAIPRACEKSTFMPVRRGDLCGAQLSECTVCDPASLLSPLEGAVVVGDGTMAWGTVRAMTLLLTHQT